MLTVGSLFDGIGGFPLAAVHNGVTPLWASEIEPFPIAVTKIRFPDMRHVGDITKLDGGKLPPVDVICGGSPCQDLSVAGKRQGLAGERSGLFMEQVRIVKEMRDADERRNVPAHLVRPRYMVWENVPGAFSSADGEDFRAVLEEIVRVKDGSCHVPRPDSGRWESAGGIVLGDEFSLAWRVIDAQYWGVAQRRRRIFLVADFGGLTAPEILFKQDSLFGNPAEVGKEGQGTAAPAQGGADAAGGNHDITAEKETRDIFAFHINQREETIDLGGVSGALLATRNMQMQTFITEKEAKPLLCLNDQGGSVMECSDDVSGTLRAQGHGHQPLVFDNHGQDARFSGPVRASQTVSAGFGMGGNNQPLVLATQQGGAELGVGVCPAITASAGMSGNNQPVLFENHGIDARYTGPHPVAPTMSARYGTGGNNVPLVGKAVAFSLDSKESNSMKSANPYSGCRETEVARTIDTANPDPSKNQGGIAILQESFCIAGNIIDRQPENGGNGCGYQTDIAYTLTGMDRHAVFSRQRSDEFLENEVSATQSARQHKDATDLISQPYQQVVGALCMDDGKGINNQHVGQDKCIVENRNLIRRLTPLECERLQGLPDGWTDIPGASDSARYKALGNSVAIPCVDFVLRGIAYFLRKIRGE